MKSTVETLGPTRVSPSGWGPVRGAQAELRRRLQEDRRPGPDIQGSAGKAPARIIDQRIGRAAVIEEAVNTALPKHTVTRSGEWRARFWDSRTLRSPALDDGKQLAFTAEVDVRPEITLPDLTESRSHGRRRVRER